LDSPWILLDSLTIKLDSFIANERLSYTMITICLPKLARSLSTRTDRSVKSLLCFQNKRALSVDRISSLFDIKQKNTTVQRICVCTVTPVSRWVSQSVDFTSKTLKWSNQPRGYLTFGVWTASNVPSSCREDNIHEYQQCLRDYVIPDYKVHEGGQPLYCRHMDVTTLKVSRSQKNPFRPYFTCRRKEMCRFFHWADEMPVGVSKRL